MSRARAVTRPVDALAGILAEIERRVRSLEIGAHRHDTASAVLLPAGSIVETLWLTDPLGFLLLDGRTIANGDTLYPALWAVAPGGWKSGTSLVLPTSTGKMVRAF